MTTEALPLGIIGGKIQMTVTKDGATWDLTAATAKIGYNKADGQGSGEFAATVDDAANGIISYVTTAADDLDVDGNWEIWPIIDQGAITGAKGKPAVLDVFDN